MLQNNKTKNAEQVFKERTCDFIECSDRKKPVCVTAVHDDGYEIIKYYHNLCAVRKRQCELGLSASKLNNLAVLFCSKR